MNNASTSSEKKNKKNITTNILIVILILLAGIAIAGHFMNKKEAPVDQESSERGPGNIFIDTDVENSKDLAEKYPDPILSMTIDGMEDATVNEDTTVYLKNDPENGNHKYIYLASNGAFYEAPSEEALVAAQKRDDKTVVIKDTNIYMQYQVLNEENSVLFETQLLAPLGDEGRKPYNIGSSLKLGENKITYVSIPYIKVGEGNTEDDYVKLQATKNTVVYTKVNK